MEINWIAIVVAGFIPSIVGFVWYGILFKNVWLKSTGKPKEYFEKGNMVVIHIVSILLSMFFALVIKILIETTHGGHLGIDGTGSFHTFKHGVLHGVILSFFFALPYFMIDGLFERKPQTNIWLSIGFWVISGGLIGGLVDAWC